MNKAIEELQQILAHQKAAKHHVLMAEKIARRRYQFDLGNQLDAAAKSLEQSFPSAELVYGKAVRAAVRRAR